jgi:hypothetical protein
MADLDIVLFGPPSQDASADESRAQELEAATAYGELKAVQTGGQMTRNISDSLANINAVYTATGLMSGGDLLRHTLWMTGISDPRVGMMDGPPRFQDFRRSDDIEDRRKQYSQNPQGPPTNITFEQAWSTFADDMLRGTSPLSKALGIDDIPTK